MTEPTTGSDLQAIKTYAVKEGDDYIINGSKTFITNGQHANLIVLACKTDREKGAQGVSLIVVETDGLEGFERGRNLKKPVCPLKTPQSCSLAMSACHKRTY
nr:acyl-CoA dehydrogenase family protein [Psychrobacter sp. PraFG1]UNK06406.1 acyl-CoA dehydrogenase family protein [Psychrobacter sp. PraFG1]